MLLRFAWNQFKAKKLRQDYLWFWDIFQISLFTILIGTLFSSFIESEQIYFYVCVGYCSFIVGKGLMNSSAVFQRNYNKYFKKAFIDKKRAFLIVFTVAFFDHLIFVGAIFFLGWIHFGFSATVFVLGSLLLVLFIYFIFGVLLAIISHYISVVGLIVAQFNRYAIFITPVLYDKKMLPEDLIFILFFNPHYWSVTLLRSSWSWI